VAASHSRLFYHVVFGTRHHDQVLAPEVARRLHAYIAGIVRHTGGTPIAIGGAADHVHVLMEFGTETAIATAARNIKANSSRWIHQTYPGLGGFAWQDGYGAFTVSVKGVEQVKGYIADQEGHHRKTSFREEYAEFLRANGIVPDGERAQRSGG